MIEDNQMMAQRKQQELQKVQLHKLVSAILLSAENSKPYMPTQLTKKICQDVGLNSNEQTFYKLMSNIIDYSLDGVINNAKQYKIIAKQKKQSKDFVLKTSDLEKLFEEKQIFIARPRIYPIMGLNLNQNKQDLMIPEQQQPVTK